MQETNILRVAFGSHKAVTTEPVWRWDYGRRVLFTDLDLPTAYEVHFASGSGDAYVMIGDETGAPVPDTLLTEAETIDAYVFVHASEEDGETMRVAHIPVQDRQKSTEEQPEPHEQSVIDQTIAALNAAVEQTAEDVEAADLSAQEAAAQADRAETAQEAAEAAQITAVASASAAATSAANASAWDDAARASATSARNSATAAASAAEIATEKATAAAESAETAADGAEEAGTAASAASGSAATAAASATTAGGAATNAATSAERAAASAASASGAASRAAASETAAAGSKADAETAAQSAASSATIATTKAEEAAGSAEAAAEDAEEIRALGSGIATEPTAEQILAQVAAILPLVQEIADNGMGGGSLNGFSLNMGENGEVILYYTNPEDETDTDSATMPTASTGAEVIAELQNINSALTAWANRGNA